MKMKITLIAVLKELKKFVNRKVNIKTIDAIPIIQ